MIYSTLTAMMNMCSSKTAFLQVVCPCITAIDTDVGIDKKAKRENASSQKPMSSEIPGNGR